MKKKIKLLLIGGGSGGHLYPLLTLAQEACCKYLQPEDLHFIIADNNADFKYFESNDLYKKFTYSEYSVAKLRRYFSWQNFLDFFVFFKNIVFSFVFLLFNRPEKIFSKGGFVSLPFGISAFLLRIPFYLHETDSVMGLSNTILSKFAQKVFTGFPLQNSVLSNNKKYVFVGNPVRAEFFDIPDKKNDQNDIFKILLFGGSQGAQALNEWARTFFDISKNTELVSVLQNIQKNIEVLIISGKNKLDTDTVKNINISNKDFLNNVKSVYTISIQEREFLTSDFVETIHSSDIIFARAGGSIAELAASRKCTVVIPLPTSANNHQQKNAEYFASEKAVLHISEKDLYTEKTYSVVNDLLENATLQKKLSEKLGEFSRANVVENIIKELHI